MTKSHAEEAARMRLFPGIGFRGRPRRAWVIGSGLDVREIVDMLHSYDGNAAKLVEHHPLVTETGIRIAGAYAERFPDEVVAQLRLNHRPLDELRATYPFLQSPSAD
jgi:uncharacterized protein (DUF433 family)